MPELAQGRFFEAYGAAMDAALEAKVRDIEPWLVPGLVVDRGCGTGSLMKHLAARGRKVVGIDLSDALSAREAGVIQANVMEPVFSDGFVANIVMSSVMHEVYSYSDYSMSAVVVCLSSCARELRPGGRIIVRDMWAPERDARRFEYEMDADVWLRFLDFLERTPRPVEVEDVNEARRSARMSMRTAAEFLSKKDYVQHWELELKEVFTSVPLSAYREIARTLRLNVVRAEPMRNEWIVANRLMKGVRGEPPPFTNQLVVLERAE
jgi:SAM-dependent methyltransferase